MSDLVHDVETTLDLCSLLTASASLFLNMSDTQFHEHHSYFKKHFQTLLAVEEGGI